MFSGLLSNVPLFWKVTVGIILPLLYTYLITGPGAPSLRSFAHVYSRLGCWIQDSTSFLLGRHLSRFAIALHNSL